MKTSIISCTCVSPYQDLTYGKGKRVANNRLPTASTKQARCTVCGQLHTRTKPKEEPASAK